MTHEQLVEIVAKAMAKEDPFVMQMMTREEAHELASAALSAIYKAMKEPTPEMVEAGWIDKEDVDPGEIFNAMLSASPLNGGRDE